MALSCWLTQFNSSLPPSSASQPAEGGGWADQVCSCWPPNSDGGDRTKGFSSGTAAERTGSKVQGADLASQEARRVTNSDPGSGAECGSEPGRAGQPGDHTGLVAPARGR